MKKTRTKDSRDDEPLPEGEEWVEWCGVRLWVAGWTSGGAPYGLTVDEWRSAMRESEHPAGWARAWWVLETLFTLRCGTEVAVEVGRVSRLGRGMSRDAFVAWVSLEPDPEALSGQYVALLPRPESEPDHDTFVRRELLILEVLGQQVLPFRVPLAIGALPLAGKLALVQRAIGGITLDLRAGRQSGVRPWEVVGQIAAALHTLELPVLRQLRVPGAATRRDHALEALAVFNELDAPEAVDAQAWALEHLPPPEPARLTHGDLLGQNILIEPNEPPAVIDWTCASFGDPAWDLAVVTRGVRRPFQTERGLAHLLDAYRAAGGVGLQAEHVRLYELAMAATWYRESLAPNRNGGESPAAALARIERILTLATR
ncbi:MAG: aminoglycoside phosphotransferase family protein [Polyangiaceae bacterium]|nr:aminoglycoside phosphotransferase family protein [Polyangiaceae bacterium]